MFIIGKINISALSLEILKIIFNIYDFLPFSAIAILPLS